MGRERRPRWQTRDARLVQNALGLRYTAALAMVKRRHAEDVETYDDWLDGLEAMVMSRDLDGAD